jgi:hypothetical protein
MSSTTPKQSSMQPATVTMRECVTQHSIARDRFIAATHDEAITRMEHQSALALDAVATVNAFPYIYTNAGVLAEACAHWAFIAYPELRADDDTFWSDAEVLEARHV